MSESVGGVVAVLRVCENMVLSGLSSPGSSHGNCLKKKTNSKYVFHGPLLLGLHLI